MTATKPAPFLDPSPTRQRRSPPHCHAICAAVSRSCSSGGQALSVDAAEELEGAKGIVWRNPETVLEIAAEVRRRLEAKALPPTETARQPA